VSGGLQRIFGLAALGVRIGDGGAAGPVLGFYLLFGATDLSRGLAGWVPPGGSGAVEPVRAGGQPRGRRYARARVLAALFVGA